MTRTRVVEIGSYEKVTLKDKLLIRADPNFDYIHNNIVGKILVDERGNRIGKVLDVIGNVNEPYLLVNPVSKGVPEGKLYVILEERKKQRRGRK